MTNVKEYIQSIGNHFGITDPDFMLNVSRLLVNNNWYGCQPVQTNGKLKYIKQTEWGCLFLRKVLTGKDGGSRWQKRRQLRPKFL